MERFVDELRATEPTYNDVGATLAGQEPKGFHIDHYATASGYSRRRPRLKLVRLSS